MYVGSRFVPWFDINEFQRVITHIESADDTNLCSAVHLMQVWLCRVNASKIPRAILCAYELFLAQVQNSSSALAIATMRFITLMTSEEQDRIRGGFAIPAYSLARQAGLPSWISELRNDIAHGSLPSRSSLDRVFAMALQWIKGFWRLNLSSLEAMRCVSCPFTENSVFSTVSVTDLNCPIHAPVIVRSFAKRMIHIHPTSTLSSDLKSSFKALKQRNLINDLVVSVFGLLPEVGSAFWASRWLEAYDECLTHSSSKSRLAEYISKTDIDSFPWRHCVELVCLYNNCDTMSLLSKIFIIFRRDTQFNRLAPILKSLHKDDSNSSTSSQHVCCNWKLDRKLRWWRIPLGFPLDRCTGLTFFHFILDNASSGRRNQGFPGKNTQVGCQV